MKSAPAKFTTGGVPILLSTSVALAQGVGAVIPDLGKLQQPFRQPMVIDDIGFILSGQAPGGHVNWGGSVRVQFNLGRLGLCSTQIPVWSYCPLLDDGRSLFSDSSEEFSSGSGLDFAGAYTSFCRYRWKLPRPLFVSPGNVLVPSFSRTADGFTGNLTAVVAYNARRLPEDTPVPREIDVPYVASFITGEGKTYAISSDQDLYNPFVSELHVQRFTGRLQARQANVYMYDGALSPSTPGDDASNITVKISDSRGRDIVPNYTRWGTVFSNQRRAITLPCILNAKDHYTVYYSAPTGIGRPGTSVTGMVAMIGYRTERMTD